MDLFQSIATNEKLAAISEKLCKNSAVSAEAMAEAFTVSETIRKVKVSFHMPGCSIHLGKSSSLKNAEEYKDFLEKNGNNLILEMFPKEYGELRSIRTSLVKCRQKYSIGRSDYMPLSAFKDSFLPFLQEKTKRVDEIKDSIRLSYKAILESFSETALEVCEELCPDNLNFVSEQLAYFSSRSIEEFLSKIHVDLETDFEAKQMDRSEYEALLTECKNNAILSNVSSIVEGLFSGLADALLSFLSDLCSKKFCPKGIPADLSVIPSVTEKFRKRVSHVHEGALCMQDENFLSMTKGAYDLSFETDGTEVPNAIFDAYCELYTYARKEYGVDLSFGEKTQFGGSIPEWFKMSDVLAIYDDTV